MLQLRTKQFHDLQSKGCSLRRRENTHFSWATEGTENLPLQSITDTPELSEAEKGKATDWGPSKGHRGAVLTHRQQVAIVLQHHLLVQVLLRRGQELPLLPREVHSHIVKRQGFL